MPQVVVKGESVYKCTTCDRSIRVPTNKRGLDVLDRCNITYGCLGKLRRVTSAKDINSTPAFPPEQQGVQDWFQRRVLYSHNQPIQSNTWIIKHNLANKPKVYTYVNRVINSVDQLVEAEPITEVVIDLNTIQLTFATTESGLAQCVALASQNVTNPSSTTISQASTEPFQITSNGGELTIATLLTTSLIGVALTYLTSGTTANAVIEYAGIPQTAGPGSPWSGASVAVINGRQYVVRSFNIISTPLAPAYFDANAISEGSRLFLSSLQGNPPTLGQCLILLGKPPYGTVDKLSDRYIDVSQITPLAPEIYYSNGVLFTQPSLIRQTYPQILVV